MQKSTYVDAVPGIVSDMQNERERQEGEQNPPAQDDRHPELVLYRYHTESGGVVLSSVPLEDDPQPLTVDSQEPETDQRPRTHRAPTYFLHFLLILLIFVALDNVDSVMAQFAPTATVTIQPVVKTLSTTGSVTIGGAGADIQGRVLPPLTLSQEQTVVTTGKGYQKATQATGEVTFYNGLSTGQSVLAGTVLTGYDGLQIVTTQTARIPPADSTTTPPTDGYTTVSAQAVRPGGSGNIPAYEVSVVFSSSLTVKNLAAFHNGRDERHFSTVAQSDIDGPAQALKAQVTVSMSAALHGEVHEGQQLLSLPCAPVVTTNHHIEDEAQSVTVQVSETCSGISYSASQLQTAAVKILTNQATRKLGHGFKLDGTVQVTIARSTHTTLVLSLQSVWIYQVNEQAIRQQVSGKSRLTALQLLVTMPGIQRASVSGIEDNQPLPTDPQHVRIVLIVMP